MKVKWNRQAFQQIRKSPEVQADIGRRVQRIAAACGDGYDYSVMEGRTRARGTVITAKHRAIRDNAKHNTLLRNLNVGR